MIKSITFILMFSCLTLYGQSWDWDWAQQLNGADGVRCQVKAVDDHNQSYLLVTYADTLTIGDTTFSHPYPWSSMQCAVAIFGQDGSFRNAMDFHSDSPFLSALSAVRPRNSHAILIGGEYSHEFHASDTVMITDAYGDLFIGEYNEEGRHKWLKTIKSDNGNNMIDVVPAENGDFYIVGVHNAGQSPSQINFFGVDSVEHTNSLIYVIKVDSLCNIIWRKGCINPGGDVWVRNAVLGEDGSIYIQGETRSSLVFGTDTLFFPGTSVVVNFIYAYDGQGNLVVKQLRNWPVNLDNLYFDANRDIIFSGSIYNSAYFKNDSIIIPQNHFPCILGKVDSANNLLWYHLYEPQNYGNYHWLEFSAESDTIYAALTFEFRIDIGDTTYLGPGRRTLIMQYSSSGTLLNIHMLQGNNLNYTYRVIPDNCSDIVMGGLFTGPACFGADTLQTGPAPEGFIARVKRWNHAIDLGPDTLINYSGSAILSAGEGYDQYRWSTGETGSSIQLTGAGLGVGPHTIFLSVFNKGCESWDTVVVTVKNNMGAADFDQKSGLFHIFPNPVNEMAVIEYELSCNTFVQVKIMDMAGNEFDIISDQQQQKGKYKINYDTKKLAPGIYYVQALFDEKTETRKMIVIK